VPQWIAAVLSRRACPTNREDYSPRNTAFDRTGARLGHGKGFYDRLLAQVRPDALLVAPAFECQLFDHIPMLPHDVPVRRVVTEMNVYQK
jgi:5-formyltetrahydrofolate cyclo-ligase